MGSGAGVRSASSSNDELLASGAGGAAEIFGAVKIGAGLRNVRFGGAITGEFTGGRTGVSEAGFVPTSPLRNKPRATRRVPLDCSTLIGLVRTRLAPIRKALATPAWPSTTATESEDWLIPEFRALLNNSVAFCSLSQSTTTASKCCAMSFFTAANGSLQGSTVKSSSVKTWVTTRAVFSSGQNNNAW